MNLEQYRNYCLSLPGAEEKMPFDKTTLIFTVGEKIFSSTNIETFELINVKCDPSEAIKVRQVYADVVPGYYMNKKHWNSIWMEGEVKDDQIKERIRNSYELVVSGLHKKVQKSLSK